MDSWVLETFLWLNGVMFALAIGTYIKRSMTNDSGR